MKNFWAKFGLIPILSYCMVECQVFIFDELPSRVVTYEAGFINITCLVTNIISQINYTWTKENDKQFIIQGQVLYLDQLTNRNAGRYFCNAKGGIYEDMSPPVELEIQYTPRWPYQVINKFAAAEGESAAITCQVLANPTCNFVWIFNEKNLTSCGGRCVITSSFGRSDLQISSVTASDFGNYSCIATNFLISANITGIGIFPVFLLKPGKPEIPFICMEVEVGQYSVIISCIPGYQGGQALKFAVYGFSTSSDRHLVQSSFYMNSSSAILQVSHLDPNTSWTLEVFQSNNFGLSEEGYALNIETLPGSPLAHSSTKSLITTIIIAAAGGGGFLLLLLFVGILCCCCCRRHGSKPHSLTTRQQYSNIIPTVQRNSTVYIMEEEDNQSNTAQEGNTANDLIRALSARNSWGSVRRKKGIKAAGANGHNTANALQMVHYNGPQSHPEVATVTANPSELGFINPNYIGDSSNSSFGGDIKLFTPNQLSVYGNIQSNPQSRTQQKQANSGQQLSRLPVDQPSLAGSGALYGNPVYGRQYQQLSPRQNSLLEKISVQSIPAIPAFQPTVPWEFPKEKLYIRLKLGEGNFGEVWRARACNILGEPEEREVAVKMLKANCCADDRKALLKELEIMKRLQPHPNIISLLGCCTKTSDPCIILEFASNGNLQDLLREQRYKYDVNSLMPDTCKQLNLSVDKLTEFASHVCSGMEYISSLKLLHRDLATRNVLLDAQFICKICDFGSSRDIMQMRQYESMKLKRLPIRWMAPESLCSGIYDIPSDVWSYGILLWEMITLGSTPYPGLTGPEVMQFVSKGCRMPKPKYCSDALYSIMTACWGQYPPKRPTFTEISEKLSGILTTQHQDVDLKLLEENLFDILVLPNGEKC